MDEIEKFAKQIHNALKEINLGTRRQQIAYVKEYIRETNAEAAKRALNVVKEARQNAWYLQKAIELNDQNLIYKGETLVVDTIWQAFEVQKWDREGTTFTFKVLELDEPLIIKPESNI